MQVYYRSYYTLLIGTVRQLTFLHGMCSVCIQVHDDSRWIVVCCGSLTI